jgi:hypothetical protein
MRKPKGDRGTGDRRAPEILPGYDPDWRDPRNAQVYPDPLLDLDALLDLQKYADLNLQDLADRLRVVTRHDAAAAFALMTGLADERLRNEAVSFCDPFERPVARAYQAAMKVIGAHYIEKRLRVGATYLAAARIVVQCVEAELLLHDLPQKKRELSALAKGKAIRLSPWTFNTVADVLARYRDLQVDGKAFEGSRLDAVAKIHGRDRSTIGESVNFAAIPNLQEVFGRYCNDFSIPPNGGSTLL